MGRPDTHLPSQSDDHQGRRDRWLALAVDEPRFVEARGLLLAQAPLVPAGPDAALALAEDDGLAVLIGSTLSNALRLVVLAAGVRTLLVQDEMEGPARAALHDWDCARATLHTLSPDALPSWPADPPHVRRLALGAVARRADSETTLLEHVPEDVRLELQRASARGPLFCADDDGLPVSFAYGAYETESLVDVSIETLAPWRGRGLAAGAVRALIRHIVARGRRPVWGALDANTPSLRLGRRLGFEACATLWVLSRPQRLTHDPTTAP